jgi:hypothetical protein
VKRFIIHAIIVWGIWGIVALGCANMHHAPF